MRPAMLFQHQDPALVAGDEIVSLARLSHAQEKNVRRISGTIHVRQPDENHCLGLELIDETAHIVTINVGRQPWTTTDRSEFVQLLFGANKFESPLVPSVEQARRKPLDRNESADEQIRVKYDAHQTVTSISGEY